MMPPESAPHHPGATGNPVVASSEPVRVPSFDVLGPLPTGTTLVEASAGTGKTYAIGALVTRFVAEQVAELDQLLVITFGRTASQELRERVRGQLVGAERALRDPAAARRSPDPLTALLADVPDAEVVRRRERVRSALAGFDAATIVTTHQFCHHVLTGLGVAGDSDPGVTLVEDLEDLTAEVVDDLYVRAFARGDAEPPPFTRATALTIARAAIDDPDARLEPGDAAPGSPARRRVDFCRVMREEMERRKRRLGILGYDDLLGRLADALEPEDAAARHRMRQRWSIVLVDEFQDTDPVQWQILRRAFVGHRTVVLVGDPKQAIYAFRGGDVVTYLAAAAQAATHQTLGVNWRADRPVVDGLQVLLGGLELGDRRIPVRPVAAARDRTRLVGAPSSAPLRLRLVSRAGFGIAGRRPITPIGDVRDFVGRDLAADVNELLRSGARFGDRALEAGDLAVIVATHQQAGRIQAALHERGVPAVVAGNSSVFKSEAAHHWLTLLDALDRPHRASGIRAAALTPFVGHSATDLALGGDRLDDELSARFTRWSGLLSAKGVAALMELADEGGMPARVLTAHGGDRLMTDLRHVGEELHAAAVSDGLGISALAEWLRRRRSEPADIVVDQRARRLDTDAAAVQVVTQHASKGLQFPVVYLPFAFDRWVPDEAESVLLHGDDGRRVLDVGGTGADGRQERAARAASEDAGESLRLLYVALTRAQSQVVLWWAPTYNTPPSALHRVLFGRVPGSGILPETEELVTDDAAERILADLQRRGGPVVEQASPAATPVIGPAPQDGSDFRIGRWTGSVGVGWRRMSYSSLSAAGRSARPAPGVGSEPETGERDDEELGVVAAADAGARLGTEPAEDLPSPMAGLPAGTSFGTLVHAVLERTDPEAGDLRSELARRAGEELGRLPLAVRPEELADALYPVLCSPLGPLADGLTLRDVPMRDRLSELEFELPVAGGDAGTGDLSVGRLGPLLQEHLGSDDPFAEYGRRMVTGELSRQTLCGYLTGSLDAVLRLPGPRYLVVDYKTNWLGPLEPDERADRPLTAWDYRPAALRRVMGSSDYPLQALLYCVALHRFLRWRRPDYRPGRHFGGVLYLFVRGMCGPRTPIVEGQPCGVFSWQPPVELITAVSDVLDTGRSDRPDPAVESNGGRR